MASSIIAFNPLNLVGAINSFSISSFAVSLLNSSHFGLTLGVILNGFGIEVTNGFTLGAFKNFGIFSGTAKNTAASALIATAEGNLSL